MNKKERRIAVVVLVLSGLFGICALTTAGDLEPSGSPGPTMKTLEEVEPRIAIHTSDLPLTITEAGSYYLVEDLTFIKDSHAITIDCNDVTIDLMGYSLVGPNSTSYDGIYISGRENIEIRNGTIRDFSHGIYEESSGVGNRVIGMRVISNSLYGIRLGGRGHIVKDCTSSGNGNSGIYLNYGCIVTGCTAYDNGTYGISAITGCTVTGNAVYSNNGNGISIGGPGCTVIGNTACNNGGSGIYTDAYCTVTDNAVYNNSSYGIYTGSGSTITNNTVEGNGGRGIYVNSYGTVSGNTVNYNESHGIYAGSYSTVSNNVLRGNNASDTASGCGICVSSDCMVKGNTLSANKRNNILVLNSDNAVEENLVTDCTGNGISFNTSGNFYANNRASGNGTNYDNGAAQTDGGGNYSF